MELVELLACEESPPTIPCRSDPEAWFSLDPAEIVGAIARCQACPLIAPCDALAHTIRPRGGVWGGVIWNENGRPGVGTMRARRIAEHAAQVRGDAA